MEFLKELFKEPLTFEAFVKACADKGYKLADLSGGDYVAQGKLTEQTDKVKALSDKVAAYEAKIGELTTAAGSAEQYKADLDRLQKQIADEKAAAERAKLEQEAEAGYAGRFTAVAGDSKFINEMTRDGIYARFKSELLKKENEGKGDKEIYAALVKDAENIFANPNAPQPIPGQGNVPSSGTVDEEAARAVMGLPPRTK